MTTANNVAESPKKIAVVGKAPSSKGLAPCSDDTFEIWTLSDLVLDGTVSRFDKHFEMHPVSWYRRPGQSNSYIEWLESVEADKTVYLLEDDSLIKAGVAYPRQEVLDHFKTEYFTNTVSYMVALAIMQQPEEIHVYGVDMAQVANSELSDEYTGQRPSCEFFLGWAAGAGIDIYVPPEADLLKCRGLYGYHTDKGGMWKKCQARRQELDQRIAQHNAARDNAHNQSVYLQGAKDAMDWTEQWI